MRLSLYLVDWPTFVLQCFDAVGWVIWPLKIVPDKTYNVFGGTLNLLDYLKSSDMHSPRWDKITDAIGLSSQAIRHVNAFADWQCQWTTTKEAESTRCSSRLLGLGHASCAQRGMAAWNLIPVFSCRDWTGQISSWTLYLLRKPNLPLWQCNVISSIE